MEVVKFTEMSSLEWQEAYKSVKNAIKESINVCPSDCVSSYKDIELDTYWNNLIGECWYEKDGEEYHCDGFSIISQYILIEDEDDKAGLRDMFNDARDEVWESFIKDICECDDDLHNYIQKCQLAMMRQGDMIGSEWNYQERLRKNKEELEIIERIKELKDKLEDENNN